MSNKQTVIEQARRLLEERSRRSTSGMKAQYALSQLNLGRFVPAIEELRLAAYTLDIFVIENGRLEDQKAVVESCKQQSTEISRIAHNLWELAGKPVAQSY